MHLGNHGFWPSPYGHPDIGSSLSIQIIIHRIISWWLRPQRSRGYVIAGTKRSTCPFENDNPHLTIMVRLANGLADLLLELATDGIQLLRPIKSDPRYFIR